MSIPDYDALRAAVENEESILGLIGEAMCLPDYSALRAAVQNEESIPDLLNGAVQNSSTWFEGECRGWVTINGRHVLLRDKDAGGGGGTKSGLTAGGGSGIINSTDKAKGTVLFDKIPQNLIDYAIEVEKAENLTYKEKNRLFHDQAVQITSTLKGSAIKARGKLVVVSDHAARRMCERNITPKEVKEVLKKYDISYPSEDDPHATTLKYGEIILAASDNCVLITAIRDDKT